ncbi:MAG TPA: acyl-CoA dehydrogenase family protein [Nitrososphaerales archaeon]|nr:acyl-CoA dehydrogenase family protein [Nitrososphaerales archaeon]
MPRLLNFDESEDQKLLRDALATLASNFPDSYWRSHDESGEFPQEYFDALATNGWFNLNVPSEYGGTGLGLTEVSIAIHELSKRLGMSAGDIVMAICVFAIQTIKTFAQAPLKHVLLPELASGKHIMSFALTEPSAGVNTLDIATTARKEGDGFVINGQKIWITLAHKATLFNIVARTTPKDKAAKRTDGLTLFLVQKKDLKEGQVRTKRIEDISMRALGSNEVFFEDVYVPASSVLGKVDRGWDVLPALLNAERISTASMSCGLGALVLERAVAYATGRQVFGRPIGSNQAIQFPLARSKVDLECAWAITQKAAWQFDNGQDCSISANIAAYLGARAAFFAADRAIQTYGGLGYAKNSDVERHWRDSRLFRTGPVPEEMVLNFIGQRVLRLPRSY